VSVGVLVLGIGVALVLAMLGAALLLAVVRIVRGPTILDRVIGSDLVLTTVLVLIAAVMVTQRDLTAVPALVVIAATSVFATIAVARAVTPSSDDEDVVGATPTEAATAGAAADESDEEDAR
jgi:multicomponent Na+:H+ antiporter subunit F